MSTHAGKEHAMTAERFLERVVQRIRRHITEVDSIELIGSRARGDARPNSDWDILITTSNPCERRAVPGKLKRYSSRVHYSIQGRIHNTPFDPHAQVLVLWKRSVGPPPTQAAIAKVEGQ